MHQKLLDLSNIFNTSVIDNNAAAHPRVNPSATSELIPVLSPRVDASPVE